MCDLHPVIEQGEQSLGTTPCQGFAVVVAKTYPQAVELGRLKGLPLRFESSEIRGQKKTERTLPSGTSSVLPIGVKR